MALLQVIAGLAILVFAGDGLVRGAVTLADKLGVPTLVISLTIIAFGTSAPELVVGVNAVMAGAPGLALGNVVGSNIANTLLVLGVPALIYPVACCAPRLGRNYATMIAASAFMLMLGWDGALSGLDGPLLVLALFGFLGYSAHRALASRRESKAVALDEDLPAPAGNIYIALLLVFAGLIGLIFGADLLVTGAVSIADDLGVPKVMIGLTIVAIGTSLPELVTVIAAAVKKESDVALGSVVGSNIFNVLGILGVSSSVGSIPLSDDFLAVDVWVMIGSALLVTPFIFFKSKIGRLPGILLLICYIGYMGYLVFTGAIPDTV